MYGPLFLFAPAYRDGTGHGSGTGTEQIRSPR
jgi:hypothetical protein